jgi:hypothetical protein
MLGLSENTQQVIEDSKGHKGQQQGNTDSGGNLFHTVVEWFAGD